MHSVLVNCEIDVINLPATILKATTLDHLADNVSEVAVLSVLGTLSMKGQAYLPTSKQLNSVTGVDIYRIINCVLMNKSKYIIRQISCI